MLRQSQNDKNYIIQCIKTFLERNKFLRPGIPLTIKAIDDVVNKLLISKAYKHLVNDIFLKY